MILALCIYLGMSVLVGLELALTPGNIMWKSFVVGFMWPWAAAAFLANVINSA